jgi:hypothetical protein
MMRTQVEYRSGYNNTGTGQHEVLEYGFVDGKMEGPYAVLYTESAWAATAIAAILTADGGDNNYPPATVGVVTATHTHDGLAHTHDDMPFAPFAGGPWQAPHEER